jgi:uncharacterized protein (TIGR02598 family)
MRLRTSISSAFTLVESMIAIAISAFFLASVFTLNISSMDAIRCAKESASAGQMLQQRIESLRIANWQEITSPTWVADNVLNTDAAGAGPLKNLNETLTMVPYGSTAVGNTTLTRTNGNTTIVNSIPLLAENAIKVIWTLDFTGAPNDRAVTRQIVAILANGGVAK